MSAALPPLDYRTAFDLAPIGLVISANRLMVDCNQQLLDIFGATRGQLIGQSFEVLYPTHDEFERTGARIVASLNKSGWYADERVMKRTGGPRRGELFWCHVSGRALNPKQPHVFMTAKAIQPGVARCPVAAVHPISGGTAPGIAPIRVQSVDTRLSGV